MSTTARAKKHLDIQPSLLAYAAGISTLSPGLTAYQLTRVYGKAVPPTELARMSLRIFPHQIGLKWLQMNCATPVKSELSPWVAFGVVGVLQGGVYGQCIVHFSKALKLAKTVSIAGMFRGSGFAGLRDTISQGVPFMYSATVQERVVDPLLAPATTGEAAAPTDDVGHGVRRAVAVMGSSIFATLLSQGTHNCQIKMQADHALSYGGAMRELWAQHGVRALFTGASARVALLLLVNGLNELLLKKAWAANEKPEEAATTLQAAAAPRVAPPLASTSMPPFIALPMPSLGATVVAKEKPAGPYES